MKTNLKTSIFLFGALTIANFTFAQDNKTKMIEIDSPVPIKKASA
jgi:hypothetical protein